MGKKMKVEFFDEGVDALNQIGLITGRRADQVVSDALRTYLWILHQQTFGNNIASTNGGPNYRRQPVAPLVEDKKIAKAYFARLGW